MVFPSKWTNEEIQKDALLYSTKTEWAKKSDSAYRQAAKRGIRKQCCAHMTQDHRKWTIEKLKECGKKYKFRSEWDRTDRQSYEAARRNNVLDECCLHMKRKQNPYIDKMGVIYAFIFEDNTVYIGLTISPKTRYNGHLLNGPVSKKIKEKIKYEYKILEDNISIDDLPNREIYYIEEYKLIGFNLINKRKGGCLGTMGLQISNKSIMASALKYDFRSEWLRAERGHYDAARRRKILEKACGHMKPKKRGIGIQNSIKKDYLMKMGLYISDDIIKASASKYIYRSDWQKAEPRYYDTAQNRKILDIVCQHMPRRKKKE